MGQQQHTGGSDRHAPVTGGTTGGATGAEVGGDVGARLALAQNRRTPPATLFQLASDPSTQVRAAVAARSDAPAEALRPLARDRDRQVRAAVAANPSASQGNLLRLLGDTDRKIRWTVAGNPACDERIRTVMSRTPDKELRGLLAELPALESHLAAALIDDASPEVRERLATHTHHPEVITALMADRSVRVRKGVARNVRTTAEQRRVLAQDPAVDVRCALVHTVELAEDDLLRLTDDRSPQVRLSMATSAVVPAHIRQLLENDADESVADEARTFRPAPATTPAAAGPTAAGRPATTAPGRSLRGGPNRFVTGRGRPGNSTR